MATNERVTGEEFSRYVGEQIKGEAATRGVTVTALAQRMNIDRVTLHRYLSGKRVMPVTVLYEAGRALGITPQQIMDRAMERLRTERSK